MAVFCFSFDAGLIAMDRMIGWSLGCEASPFRKQGSQAMPGLEARTEA